MPTILDKDAIREKMKDVTREVIHRSKKPLKAIAAETGIGHSHLERSAITPPVGCNFPIEWVPLVTISADNYLILDTLEQYVGRVGIPLPPLRGASPADVCRAVMKSVKEFGELIAEVERSVNGNCLDSRKRARIQKEGYEALQTILILLSVCKDPEKKIFEV